MAQQMKGVFSGSSFGKTLRLSMMGIQLGLTIISIKKEGKKVKQKRLLVWGRKKPLCA